MQIGKNPPLQPMIPNCGTIRKHDRQESRTQTEDLKKKDTTTSKNTEKKNYRTYLATLRTQPSYTVEPTVSRDKHPSMNTIVIDNEIGDRPGLQDHQEPDLEHSTTGTEVKNDFSSEEDSVSIVLQGDECSVTNAPEPLETVEVNGRKSHRIEKDKYPDLRVCQIEQDLTWITLDGRPTGKAVRRTKELSSLAEFLYHPELSGDDCEKYRHVASRNLRQLRVSEAVRDDTTFLVVDGDDYYILTYRLVDIQQDRQVQPTGTGQPRPRPGLLKRLFSCLS